MSTKIRLSEYKDPETGYIAIFPPFMAHVRRSLARHIVLHSGRGPGKSLNVAYHMLCESYEQKLRNACFREIQRSMADSSKQILDDWTKHPKAPWPEGFWDTSGSTIRGANGSTFIFRGLSSSTGTDRSVQSLEGIDRVWVEEAQNISEDSYNLLVPTIRKPGSRFYWTFNPRFPTDPVWKYLAALKGKDPNVFVMELSWEDNPFWTAELEQERQRWLKYMPESYDHIWRGKFRSDKDNVLVPFANLMACHMNNKLYEYLPEGPFDLGFDIATSPSGDKCAIAQRQSFFLHKLRQWPGTRFKNSMAEIRLDNDPMAQCLYYDATGVGSGFGDDLVDDEDFETLLEPVHLGGAVKGKEVKFMHKVSNEEMFAKRNSQLYWTLRIRAQNTVDFLAGEHRDINRCLVIAKSIPTETVQSLASEAANAVYGFTSGRKITVTKNPPNMPSPNLLDATVMGMSRDSLWGLRSNLRGHEVPDAIALGNW